MQFYKTPIEGLVVIEPTVYQDGRGYFVETYREDLLSKFLGFSLNFCQDNESQSNQGVLRGLHFQSPPYAQTKLVRVTKGRVLDVAVDIRQGSPTYGQYYAIELSEKNKKQLLIPRGFAHGFLVLEDQTIFNYKVDNYYAPEHDHGVRFNDKKINIQWGVPSSDIKISDKDQKQPLLKSLPSYFDYNRNYYE